MGCEKLDIRECFTFIGSPLQRRSDIAYTPTTPTDVAITNFTLIISTIIHNIIKYLSDIRECRLYTYDQLPSLALTLTTTYAYDILVRDTYFSNNKLVSSISLSVSSLPSVESVNAYELHSNLITSVENKHNSTTISKYDYINDVLGRGTAMEKTGTAFSANDTINYAYNPRSEVTSASSANDATYDYTFAFDTIGNRTSSSTASTTSTYSTNNLNQYTNITNPNQAPTYDDDGNMTQCSSGFQPESWSFTYNAENRVIVAESAATKLEFTYDYMGRRVEKKVYSGSTGNWTLDEDWKFVYDGYEQIEELDALNSNALAKKRVWSNGKIIADIHGTNTYYALGDANKNITEYVDGSGTVQAHYEYSPFGKITASNGAMVDDFDYRFSSEVFDDETGLVYYNFRYYSPELGRWLSRDPINQVGSVTWWKDNPKREFLKRLLRRIDSRIAKLLSNTVFSPTQRTLLRYLQKQHLYFQYELIMYLLGKRANVNSVNPYTHTKNNPIIYIDINGQNVYLGAVTAGILIAVIVYLIAEIKYQLEHCDEKPKPPSCKPCLSSNSSEGESDNSSSDVVGDYLSIEADVENVNNIITGSSNSLLGTSSTLYNVGSALYQGNNNSAALETVDTFYPFPVGGWLDNGILNDHTGLGHNKKCKKKQGQ